MHESSGCKQRAACSVRQIYKTAISSDRQPVNKIHINLIEAATLLYLHDTLRPKLLLISPPGYPIMLGCYFRHGTIFKCLMISQIRVFLLVKLNVSTICFDRWITVSRCCALWRSGHRVTICRRYICIDSVWTRRLSERIVSVCLRCCWGRRYWGAKNARPLAST
jgi:hypothetical protein